MQEVVLDNGQPDDLSPSHPSILPSSVWSPPPPPLSNLFFLVSVGHLVVCLSFFNRLIESLLRPSRVFFFCCLFVCRFWHSASPPTGLHKLHLNRQRREIVVDMRKQLWRHVWEVKYTKTVKKRHVSPSLTYFLCLSSTQFTVRYHRRETLFSKTCLCLALLIGPNQAATPRV